MGYVTVVRSENHRSCPCGVAGTRALASEQAVKTLYPNADYQTIPETAHFLMMEKPAEFNRILVRFVDGLK